MEIGILIIFFLLALLKIILFYAIPVIAIIALFVIIKDYIKDKINK